MRFFLRSKGSDSQKLADQLNSFFPTVKILLISKVERGIVAVEVDNEAMIKEIATRLGCEFYPDEQFDIC